MLAATAVQGLMGMRFLMALAVAATGGIALTLGFVLWNLGWLVGGLFLAAGMAAAMTNTLPFREDEIRRMADRHNRALGCPSSAARIDGG